MKTCTRCKSEKSENDFRMRNKRRSLLWSICRKCLNTYDRTPKRVIKHKIAKFKRNDLLKLELIAAYGGLRWRW